MMTRVLSLIYFVGLAVFGIAVGNYIPSAPIGFMLLGGGCMLYAGVMGMLSYLHHEE